MYTSTNFESLQQTVSDMCKVSSFFMMSATLKSSGLLGAPYEECLVVLGGHMGLNHHEHNFNSYIQEHIMCIANSAKSFLGSISRKPGDSPLRLVVHRCLGILATQTPSKMTKKQANFPKQFGHLHSKACPSLFSRTTGSESGILQVTGRVLKHSVNQTLRILN